MEQFHIIAKIIKALLLQVNTLERQIELWISSLLICPLKQLWVASHSHLRSNTKQDANGELNGSKSFN